MNAVEVYKKKIRINAMSLIDSGLDVEISCEPIEELTPEDKEDLRHLRINPINGALFDDRDYPELFG